MSTSWVSLSPYLAVAIADDDRLVRYWYEITALSVLALTGLPQEHPAVYQALAPEGSSVQTSNPPT
jgi:hypothetical protein